MKAVVKYAAEPCMTRCMDMPMPKMAGDEVLVKVGYAGICGTDPHMHRGKSVFVLKPPIIMGHEFAGTIEKIGRDVTGWAVGDRVAVETHADYCGECEYCRTNRYHICRGRKGYGFHTDGAFAEYVRVHPRILHRLPDSISFKQASVIEPVCVAYKAAFSSSAITPGDHVAVIGPGPIGLLCVMMAKMAGASVVAMIGAKGDDMRLALSAKLGADICVNTANEDARGALAHLGGGYGVHLVMDTAGVAPALDLSLDIIRPFGQITKIGWGEAPVNFSLDRLLQKSATLKGHFSHTFDVWERVIELMDKGMIDVDPVITHEISLEQWEAGFTMVEEKEALKAVFKIGGETP